MRLKGSITIFMSIILSALIAFSGIMVDASRLRMARRHAQAAVQLSVQSALTQYHAPMKEHYGLMATGEEQDELTALILGLLENNLVVENRYMSDYTDLYGFHIENVKVTPLFNLSEDYVLDQQIAQFMKYRAPVGLIDNFIEKLKAVSTCMAQSDVLNKRMELEKKLQKIREEQVYLSLLLSDRIHGFTDNGKPSTEAEETLNGSLSLYEEIQKIEAADGTLDRAWLAMPEYIKTIKEAQDGIRELEAEIDDLESGKASLENELDRIQDEIGGIEKKIENLKDEIEKLEGKIEKEKTKENKNLSAISSMEKEIEGYEKDINDYRQELTPLENQKDEASKKIAQKNKKIKERKMDISAQENLIREEKESLQCKVDICLEQLQDIKEKTDKIRSYISDLQSMTELYLKYHNKAEDLAVTAGKGCEAVKNLSAEIQTEMRKQSEKSDNTFLKQMRTDMKKLILNADPVILQKIALKMDENITHLKQLKKAMDDCGGQLDELIENLNSFLEKTEKIPDCCDYFEREIFGEKLGKFLLPVHTSIETTVSEYQKPVYPVEPEINQKEKNEFARWCNRVFNEDNDVDNSKDKGYQDKLKRNMEKNEEENQKDEQVYYGDDMDFTDQELENIFMKLPSFQDENGDFVNIKESEYHEDQIEDESILSKQGDKSSDLEDNYGNALNRNGSLAKKIGNILGQAGEALVKSLYVNEYIVSAFKNANNDSAIPFGIRRTGIPSNTFYEKAEVEYVIFGTKKEKTNATLAQTSIFGIRMGMNLIHVYKSPDKKTTALAMANTIAGWTGFGVPIVKNLILLGWAAGESWYDVKDINDGNPVPVYKTKDNWRLNLKSIFSGIAEEVIGESADWLKQEKDGLVDEADGALQSLVEDIVYSTVNEVFLPIEQAITEIDTNMESVVESDAVVHQIPDLFRDMDDLKEWIAVAVEKQFESIKEEAMEWSSSTLEEYKRKITKKIIEGIFESDAYRNMTDGIKSALNDIINQGAENLTDSVKKLGEELKDDGIKEEIIGTVISFDYLDYLRLLLLVVPQKMKVLRTADLMQLNMQKTLDNPEIMMSKYHTLLVVEADISIRYLFIPKIFGRKDNGQIKVRWGYGY